MKLDKEITDLKLSFEKAIEIIIELREIRDPIDYLTANKTRFLDFFRGRSGTDRPKKLVSKEVLSVFLSHTSSVMACATAVCYLRQPPRMRRCDGLPANRVRRHC